MIGWNNLAFLGADGTPVATAIVAPCRSRSARQTVQALWLWNATTQTWSRNLYFRDGTSSTQITTVNNGQTF